MQGNDFCVLFFFSVMVDHTVSDAAGRIGKKCSPVLFVSQYRFIKSKHGDAQLFILSVNGSAFDKFRSLRTDKTHVLPDQGICRFGICPGCLHTSDKILYFLHS